MIIPIASIGFAATIIHDAVINPSEKKGSCITHFTII
jgi:hypothetical protein